MPTTAAVEARIAPLRQGAGKPRNQGVRTGEQFREDLRDDRSVWCDGRRIGDVTSEPGFKGAVDTLCELYDRQFEPEYQGCMTAEHGGRRISASYLMPRTLDDLLLKRRNTEVWSRATLGFMGRFPDFCSNLIVGLRSISHVLARHDHRFGENAVRYYEYCALNDIALTHALNDQFYDRSKSASAQPDPDLILRGVRETDEGVVVRGLKNLATLSPICDEVIVYPNRPRAADEPDRAIAFAIPMGSPGLHVICRDPYGRGASDERLPLACRFDEIDATLIFEDVLVPWERIFAYRDTAMVNSLIGRINPPWSGYVTLVRLAAKLEAMAAVCEMMTRWDGKRGMPQIQAEIGRLVGDVAVLMACLRAMESDAEVTEQGFLAPASNDAYRLFGVSASDRAETIMEDLLASSLVPTGSRTDMAIPGAGPLVERFFKGLSPSAVDQMRIMAVAGDMTQSSFGGRSQLYERFHMGPPDVILQRIYRKAEIEPWVERLRAFIGRL